MIIGNINGLVVEMQAQESEVKPYLIDEIKDLGAFDVTACYNCGTCTVTCPLSVAGTEFPRKIIRYGVLGLEKKLLSMPQPWLCYYCGDCSKECPRGADPGAFMMAARRFSIIKYSIGGFAKVFYSKISALIALLLISAIATLGLFYFTENASLNLVTFNPYALTEYDFIHNAGLTLGIFVGIVALIHALKMYSYIKLDLPQNKKVPVSSKIVYLIKSLVLTVINEGAFELRYLKCEKRGRYIAHMTIAWGMILLFAASGLNYIRDSYLLGDTISSLIGTLIPRYLGIASGIITTYGILYFLYNRAKKSDEYFEYSHISDGIFLLLLFISVLTGFIIDIFMYANMAYYAYVLYFIHLIAVFDLIVTAPFTKFIHWEYRLLAVWFNEYKSLVLLHKQA